MTSLSPPREGSEEDIITKKTMKKYTPPSIQKKSSISKRLFYLNFLWQIRQEAAGGVLQAHVGVCHCKDGGGFVVRFEDGDYEKYQIDTILFLVKPEREFETFAEVINEYWGSSPESVAADWNIENYNPLSASVQYVFETEAELRDWLDSK